MNWISLTQLILAMGPQVLQMIEAIQAAFPKSSGAQKLSVLGGVMEKVAYANGGTVDQANAIQPLVAAIATAHVDSLRADGHPLFVKAAAAKG
jgi:hypothetical protein